jgi:4a-hydroxytetrahydrobiopterin dehydratase
MADLLSEQDVNSRLDGRDWQREQGAIAREWQFADFREALAFVNRVGELAEDIGHHPDILLHGYSKVKLSLMTHSAGGLTDADFAMAERLDQLPSS